MGGIERRELMKAAALGGVASSIGGARVCSPRTKPVHKERRRVLEVGRTDACSIWSGSITRSSKPPWEGAT